MTPRDSATEYLARGWAPIPVPWQKKAPLITGWQKLRVTAETLGTHFNGARQNIGILLGDVSGGLVDIDLDCAEAVIAARYLLPDTGCVFGRAGNPASHLLFLASCKTRKFADVAGDMLVELRSSGCQTLVPPSEHTSGEAIEWLSDNGPAQIEGARLTRIVGLVAAAALIARHWPAHGRHDATLALSGALRRAGLTLDQAKLFMRAVADAAHDEEAADRERAVVDTFDEGGATTGWPRLGELLGRDVVGRLREWLGAQQDPAPADRDADSERPNEPPSYPLIPPLATLRIAPAELGAARLTPTCIVEMYLFADGALLAAPGGSGKTTLLCYEGVHIVLGKPLYGLEVVTPGTVVLVTAEDRRELLIARLGRIMEAMDLSAEERATVCERVLIWDVSGAVCRLTELDRQGNVVLTGLADAIVDHFREASPVLVGLDPVISFGAGERIVNDNEHSLILAARRIVRGLGCCVRLICHTGKQVARDGQIDQYSARGGSALSDGARMVAVLRSWESEATDDKLIPPPSFSVGPDEQVIVLARPKLSYAPPQPHIWLKRRGYTFEHFIAARPDPEAEARARSEQVERFLVTQLALGAMHSQKTLEDAGIMPRAKLRTALSSLISGGRVVYAPLPEELRRGGRKEYLHPVSSPNAEELRGDVVAKGPPSSPSLETASTSPPPYREKNGGEVPAADFSLPTYHFAGEARRGSGEVGEVGVDEATSTHGNGGYTRPMDEIRGWLQRLGEDDPETISEVLEACARDPAVMDGYLRSAREVPS